MTDGWDHLRARRWQAAREAFLEGIGRRETAEGLEGLSWAAWWLDDGETVFDARERAYRLYRDRGDAAGAARMATWLASDQLDFHGAMAVASGWLSRAERLLEAVDTRAEHGWLAFMQGYVSHFQGDTDAAAERADRAADIGRRFGVSDLEMLGLALGGATLVSCAEVADGMRRLDEATAIALLEEASIPISGAWTFCFLVSACRAVADFERAAEWCDRIRDFAERYGSRYMLAYCQSDYGAIELWRGRWDQADALLQASAEDASRSRPTLAGAALAGLAELRRRQGRNAEASELVERAAAFPVAALCRARMALDGGDAEAAVEVAERVLRRVPEHRKLDRAPALEVLFRAKLALGRREEAAAAADELRRVADAVGTEALRAGADLAEGMLVAADGDPAIARTLLEDAVDGFERAGAPFETALARLELAETLMGSGRQDIAAREARAALDALSRLGAEDGRERARRLVARASGQGEAPVALPEVTPREREVLGLLADGLTNRQIAERLVLSEHTVHRHVANILRKLDLPTRAAAAALAARAGLADPPGA